MEGRTNDAGARKLQQMLADSQQRAAQRQQESLQQMSNMMKKWHDKMMQIIANMK